MTSLITRTNGDPFATEANAKGATNAGGDNPRPEEKTMHLTDLLYQARQERDDAQAKYERVLADHRATYPWLVIEEKQPQPADDMTDPANWRAGDIVECVNHGGLIGATEGRKYLLEIDPNDDELSYRDDDGD